jgi:shikimate kinase
MMELGDKSIFLIGYRGTGKTTVAELLAGQLGWSWIDADDEIERRAGKSIAAIFAEEGEPAFREREAAVVAEVCRLPRTVVALGGGAVLSEANRAAIQLAGIVVWLRATVATLAERLAADDKTVSRRPDLTKTGGLSEIETVLATREPLYLQCATFEIDTEARGSGEIVDEIVARLHSGERGVRPNSL